MPSLIVPSYTGQNQQQQIATNATPASAQGPNAIPPYPGPGIDRVPPPIQTTDLWSAMQTWPM